jgi:hypothetical protein
VDQPYGAHIEMEAEPPSPLTPKRSLLLAVLGQALKDVRSWDVDLARDAARWVASPACDELCEWLGYSAEPVRRFAAKPRGAKKSVSSPCFAAVTTADWDGACLVTLRCSRSRTTGLRRSTGPLSILTPA